MSNIYIYSCLYSLYSEIQRDFSDNDSYMSQHQSSLYSEIQREYSVNVSSMSPH